MKKEKKYYVSNKELYASYVKWYADIDAALVAGKPEPEIPPPIVDAITKICNKLSYSPQFINYSFREDMVSEAIYDCIRFVKKFNAEKYYNPFAYITTTAWRAFLRVIDSEKDQSYTKSIILAETPIHDFFAHLDGDDSEMQQNFLEFIRENGENMTNNEPMAIKRKRKKMEEKQQKLDPLSPLDFDVDSVITIDKAIDDEE